MGFNFFQINARIIGLLLWQITATNSTPLSLLLQCKQSQLCHMIFTENVCTGAQNQSIRQGSICKGNGRRQGWQMDDSHLGSSRVINMAWEGRRRWRVWNCSPKDLTRRHTLIVGPGGGKRGGVILEELDLFVCMRVYRSKAATRALSDQIVLDSQANIAKYAQGMRGGHGVKVLKRARERSGEMKERSLFQRGVTRTKRANLRVDYGPRSGRSRRGTSVHGIRHLLAYLPQWGVHKAQTMRTRRKTNVSF